MYRAAYDEMIRALAQGSTLKKEVQDVALADMKLSFK
jgi:hypothetical protein